MPSEIFNLAKSYADKLVSFDETKAKTLHDLLNGDNEPTDEEIIKTYRTLSNEKPLLTKFFEEKKDKFPKIISEVVTTIEKKLNNNEKTLLLCEEFINKAVIIQINQQQSLLYQSSDEILIEIFRLLSHEQLAKIATISSRFARIIKKITLSKPMSPRDYKKPPHIISHTLFSLTHNGFETEMILAQICLLTEQLQLVMSVNSPIVVYDLTLGQSLQSFEMKHHIVLCLAQLSDKLIISAGECFNMLKKNSGFINIWDIKNNKLIKKLKIQDVIHHLVVSSTTEFWSATNNKVTLWKKWNDEWICSKFLEIEMTDIKDHIKGIVEISTFKQLIIATTNQIFIYDIQKEEIIQKESTANVSCLQISPEKHLVIGSTDGKTYFWHKKSVEQPWENFKALYISNSPITNIVFLDDEQMVCSSLGNPKKNLRGHVRALEWKKETPERRVLLNFGIIHLAVARGLLISITQNQAHLLCFPKLQQTPSLTNEAAKNEDAKVEDQPIFVP